MFTLLIFASHCFLINLVIAAHKPSPLLLITNIHYIRYPHILCIPSSRMSTMSPHSVTPQWLCIPWLHTLPPSTMISPMAPHYVPLNDDGSLVQYVSLQWWWLTHDEEEVAKKLPLHKGMTGLVWRWLSETHEERQYKTIYHYSCSTLGPPPS